MAQKPHLRILAQQQLDEIAPVKFHYGFGGESAEEEKPEKDYSFMANTFRQNLREFRTDLQHRRQNRSPEIAVPANIEYIRITFHGQFDISKYYSIYYNEYGLEGVNFYDFGRTGLFAIIQRENFERFIRDIENFSIRELEKKHDLEYSAYVKYIKSFSLLTSNDIIYFTPTETGELVILSIIDLPLDLRLQEELWTSLERFLSLQQIVFLTDRQAGKIELVNPDYDLIKTIADNFDIIQSITCSLTSIIRPDSFNIPQRSYGFEINASHDDLPVIGIIDTGISMETPLASILIPERSFSLSGDPLVDVAGSNGEGHGTAVAALAALGKAPYALNFQGEINADARLLSLKIIESGSGYISETKLIEMLYATKEKYPELSIFVLTICYQRAKNINEPFSDYTFALDKFAHETNSLIFISTGNNEKAADVNNRYNPEYFRDPTTNLFTPADSLNNVTVGASADGLSKPFSGISTFPDWPAIYTRKGHFDLEPLYPKNKGNKNYFKPDVIESGGDYELIQSMFLGVKENASIQVLSANPAEGFYRNVGTSFSAPLVANLAAKIKKQYPALRVQTIKALIINGASHGSFELDTRLKKMKNNIAGHGCINIEKSLYSENSRPTLILEDEINDNEMKVYPLNIPDYFVRDYWGKERGLLEVTATLCFSFLPVKNNQLSYNPVHMAFCFFRNQNAEDINKKEKDISSKLKSNMGWSQSGRHVSSPIPYANSQKIVFFINKNELISESCTFKMAVQARLSKQIMADTADSYPKTYFFSLVISIEENLRENTDRLYDEIKLINHLEMIADIDVEGIAEM